MALRLLSKGARLRVTLRQAQGYGFFLRRHLNTCEAFGLHQQCVINRPLRHTLAANHHQQRHGERADAFKVDMQHRIGSAVQQITEPTHVGQPRARIGPRRLQQQMVGFIFAQHIVDKVSGKVTCLPVLRLPGCCRSTRPLITATSRKARFNK